MKEEIVFLMWSDVAGAQNPAAEVAKQTGLKQTKIEQYIREHTRRILLEDGGAEMLLKHRLELEEVRHRGRVETVQQMQDLTVKALVRLSQTIHTANPREAATIAGILTDKSLLLSGQPTSRIARHDERMMNDEQLRERVKEQNERLAAMEDEEQQLKVVKGGAA